MLHWFKSYSDFGEQGDFTKWFSCIGKGLRLQPAQLACFYVTELGMLCTVLANFSHHKMSLLLVLAKGLNQSEISNNPNKTVPIWLNVYALELNPT